ncbi:MAG: type IV secretion system DNA-binding domain-containing protein [Dehalococcoidia bacterium]
MSRRDDGFADFVEFMKLTIIVLILLAVAAVIVGRAFCQVAARMSLAVARRVGKGEIIERHAAWLAFAWLVVIAAAGIATREPSVAVIGLLFGLVVARLVWVELLGWRDALASARQPGAMVLGAVQEAWWASPKPYVLSADERAQMVTLTGATGTGKTSAGTHFIEADMWNGCSVVVVDPKGDYADAVLSLVPEHRTDDVVVVDPADTVAVGVETLQGVPEERWSLVTSEMTTIFASYFGEGSFTHRQAHLLRMAILALLPLRTATLLDIPRMFSDPTFRRRAAFQCPNEVVRAFWLGGEFETNFSKPESLSSLNYKLNAFATFPEVRAIFGQAKPRVSFEDVVDGGKILIVRAPTGVVGPDTADFLCSLVVMRTQLACHRRAGSITPRRFVALYADEASHVESGALTRLISESRSFRLGAVLMTQTEKYFSRELQIALDSNVGTRLRTFQEQSSYWMEVTRLMEEEPILFPHPGPLPPVDRVRVELIRARSRELYALPVLLPVVSAKAAPQKMTATGEVAPTTDHITTNTNEFGGIDVYEE